MLDRLRQQAQRLRGLIPPSLRYGALYRRELAFLKESQHWPEERLLEYQRRELRRLIAHCHEHVPYYRAAMQERGVAPEDIREPGDLRHLPLLTKAQITEHLPALLAGNHPARVRLKRTTGGTSGTPLGFYVERGRTDPLERAFVARFWGWLGVGYADRSVILKGHVVSERELRAGRFWQTCHPERNWTYFSAHHMSEEHLPLYARRIRELRPVFLQSFPAGLDVLARYWLREGLAPLDSLRMVHVASETLRPDQRVRFEQAFGARVFSNYGQTECAVLASECEHDSHYHVFTEYGVTEILRADGTPAAPGEVGEIVGTGFNNYVLPMLRYRTGDLGAWSRRRCACGRAYPVLERLEGRGQDVVVARDGHIMPLNAIIFGSHLPEYASVRELQVWQREPGRITLAVVPYPDFTDDTAQGMKRRLEGLADGGLEVTVQVVGHIERTAAGKFKLLLQGLPATWWDGYEPGGRE